MTADADVSSDRSLRVVVAEDESIIRLDLVEILEDEGYEVVGSTGRGDEAVELTGPDGAQLAHIRDLAADDAGMLWLAMDSGLFGTQDSLAAPVPVRAETDGWRPFLNDSVYCFRFPMMEPPGTCPFLGVRQTGARSVRESPPSPCGPPRTVLS